MRELNADEKAVFTQLAAGVAQRDIRNSLGRDLGPGRLQYCLNELAALGLYNRHEGILTDKGHALAAPRTPQPPTPPTTTAAPDQGE